MPSLRTRVRWLHNTIVSGRIGGFRHNEHRGGYFLKGVSLVLLGIGYIWDQVCTAGIVAVDVWDLRGDVPVIKGSIVMAYINTKTRSRSLIGADIRPASSTVADVEKIASIPHSASTDDALTFAVENSVPQGIQVKCSLDNLNRFEFDVFELVA